MLKPTAFGIGAFLVGMALLAALAMIASNAWLALGLAVCISATYLNAKWGPADGATWFGALVLSLTLASFVLTNESSALELTRRSKYIFATAMWVIAAFSCIGLARQKPRIWVWAVVGVVAILSISGTGHGGSGGTLNILERLGLSHAMAQALLMPLRKTIHFCFFGFVAWLGLKASKIEPLASKVAGLATALSFASFDELHQMGFASRSASIYDVALDMAGAIVVVSLTKVRPGADRQLS